MAHIEDIAKTGDLSSTLEPMGESELMAQQIVQQGATHALETLLAHGCTEQTAQDMLASLRGNMLVIEAVARDKGFARLFAESGDTPRVPSPAEQFHEAVLAILSDLMHGDPAADSPQGRLLVRLADAVEAYEKVVYPMPADAAVSGVPVPAIREVLRLAEIGLANAASYEGRAMPAHEVASVKAALEAVRAGAPLRIEAGPLELIRNAASALEAEIDAGWSPDARSAVLRLRTGLNMIGAAGVPGTEAPRTAHIRREPGGAAFLRVAAAAAVPPAPCPSYGRCTYPDCGHFLDVTSGVPPSDGGQQG